MTDTETMNPPSLKLTRRTMLRSLALTAAVAAIPATAMAANQNVPHPDDAELVSLVEEYQVLKAQNGKVLQRLARLRPLWNAEVARRGLVLSNDGLDLAGFDALEREIGMTPLQDRNERLCERMGEIEVRSTELHAATLQGLRAKLLIAYLCQGPEMKVGPVHEDQDWDVQLFNHVFADLDQMAGTITPPAAIVDTPAVAAVSELALLIDQHKRDWQAFDDSCFAADSMDDRYEGIEAEKRSAELSDIERESFLAVLEQPVRSLVDLRAKAAYLSTRSQLDNFVHSRDAAETLMRSLLGADA